ncbi:hypothetical protein [Fusobacterium sp. PH5-44]|uniref:hypothetical protein n=1 Tax=unclassified Fusobacterium TaxID=2648384 RepID=UPI003D262320
MKIKFQYRAGARGIWYLLLFYVTKLMMICKYIKDNLDFLITKLYNKTIRKNRFSLLLEIIIQSNYKIVLGSGAFAPESTAGLPLASKAKR